MEKIHQLSQITTLADFDLFTVPPTQASVEKTIVSEYRPISTLASNSIIEFLINSSIDEYIHLRETLLYMRIKINCKKVAGGDTEEADWKKVQPVCNLLHSMFKNIDLEINGKSVTTNPNTYGYKAYFETMLGYTDAAKEGFLSGSFHYNDKNKKNAITEAISKLIRPDPINTSGEGKTIDLIGKLHLDLAFQPRPLIGGMKMKLTLNPADPNFYIWHDNSVNISVNFENAALYIKKSKLSYPIVEAHNLALTKGTAKYPIMRSTVKPYTITQGSLSYNIDNVIIGQIPRRIFLAMVHSQAYTGTPGKYPFKFENFGLNQLSLSLDGEQLPSIAFSPDFTNGLYLREYASLFESLDQMNSDPSLVLSKTDYNQGNVVFGFNLAPDPCDDCNKSGYFNPKKFGSINVNLKFNAALTHNISVLLYCEYDDIIEIDSTRTPIFNFN